MMNRFYIPLIFIATCFFSGCSSFSSEEESEKIENNFSISGKIVDAGNTTLYVEALSEEGSIEVGKTTISSDGTFVLNGNIPGLGIYQLRLGEAQDVIIPLTLSPKDHLTINTSYQEFMLRPNVSGTEWASVMNKYMVYYADLLRGQQELNAMQGKASEAEMTEKYMTLRAPLDKFAIDQMRKDPDNPYNIILSTSAAPITGFDGWDPKQLDALKLVAEAFKKRYKNSPIASTMENQALQIESAYNEYTLSKTGKSSTTSLAPEIALKNPSGKILRLSSLKGKVVLVDFWASWCGPCRRENPNVVKLYKKYRAKGFEVFSVSLDNDPVAWKKAIADDGLIWTNHVSDLLGWQTPLVQTYRFDGIPFTVLVDRSGSIVATGLRGPDLEQKLIELLAK
jgi:thiol-disulfide isomerase/thioredoxin